jgi:hypothetical protein
MSHLIPNISKKPTLENWLNQSIAYDTIKKKEILEDMALETYQWMCDMPDIEPTLDKYSFVSEFINMMYNNYLSDGSSRRIHP